MKKGNFGVFINLFLNQISDHAYQWNYNIVEKNEGLHRLAIFVFWLYIDKIGSYIPELHRYLSVAFSFI